MPHEVNRRDLTIVVATHKPYWMPDDPCYLPVQVNAGSMQPIRGFQPDNVGDNISEKNPNYCELTALYWAWKNLESEYLGLAHYRRHFAARRLGDKKSRVASGDQLKNALSHVDVLLPTPRNYFIETNYSQYVHAHHEEDLAFTREILTEYEPHLVGLYDEVMNRTYGHRFNMFVMKRTVADEWCEWLFKVLFELENRLDISNYSANDARVFGFVSERLLDYWVESRGIAYVEMPVVNLESQHWFKKGASFLARKVAGSRG
ncbi:Uncharacterised protein [Slackia heliotrinireducens]|uniref:DUF4422 domain-containing protein n=1 Tax=Slackia heliotrinireducens (strain ATCC 29202 / DSM 20476 / NCTC 11029 / RHS 1) TaxID=471855 RepID=C7N5S4_SLAHD|nr:DUF4422 domain-containing protein [Slackia heliotrinireducens]ACV22259.1 hypothetical protein Shel_12310 [Slackia heliotrinireducens DSM 20476]VEH00419.1 Uncharacterised protein [Slackia heliotrinireducens]